MVIKTEKAAKRKLWWAIAAASLAGLLNGFLGAGSGVVLMFAIAALNENKGDGAARDNFATVIASVLPVSIVSTVIYIKSGAIDENIMGRFALPAIIGGIAGAFLTDRLDTKILRLVFAVVVFIAGVNMMR